MHKDMLESGWVEYILKGPFVKRPYQWKDYHFETNGNFDYFMKIADTRGYQKVLSLTWKEPEIWIYSALFFNVVPFQLHTLVPSSFPVINTRSVEVNILVP